MFKIELKLLEDELLTRLSAAESNFLGDNLLVEKLETTKHTAAEIELKVTGGDRRSSSFLWIFNFGSSTRRCWKPK